jgi:hypothetical protein
VGLRSANAGTGAAGPAKPHAPARGPQRKRAAGSVEDEAWGLLQESVVRYCGSRVGTIAACDPDDASPLNYDQVGVHQGLRTLGRRVPAQGRVRHRAQLHPAHAAAPGKVPDCSPLCPISLFVSICQYQCYLTLLPCVVSFLLMLISLSLEMKLIAKQFALKSACIYTVSVNSIFYLFLIVLKLKPLYLFTLMCEASDLKALLVMICGAGKKQWTATVQAKD